MKLFWEILGKEQIKLLPRLRFLKEEGFYLSGGTSLALQIKHRTSVDFDFYTPGKFDSTAVYQKFLEQKPENILLNRMAEDTLLLELNNTGVSLFTYPYPLIKSCVISDYLNLASLQDIAAMKMIAIIQRGIKRDFIDFYFLIKKMGLAEIFKSSKEKYPGFNEYLALQSLTYFGDAEGEGKDKKRKIKFFEEFDWVKAKKLFISEANKIKEKWKEK